VISSIRSRADHAAAPTIRGVLVPAFIAAAAALSLAACDFAASGEVMLAQGVRGCDTLSDAVQFEKIEQAHDFPASMEMLRSGRCSFVASGDSVVIEKTTLDGSTQFRQRGRDRSLWTRETIKPAARKK
jgi:hypothetical protein